MILFRVAQLHPACVVGLTLAELVPSICSQDEDGAFFLTGVPAKAERWRIASSVGLVHEIHTDGVKAPFVWLNHLWFPNSNWPSELNASRRHLFS